MRVVLVGAELEENLALRSIHSALAAAGHECALVAFDARDRLEDAARGALASRPDVVGLSMVFTRRAREFVDLARRLRSLGFSGHLVAGGHFAVLNAQSLLRDAPALDSVLAGEGEEALPALLAHLGDLEAVPGLTWRAAGGAIRSRPPSAPPHDLDGRPWPSRPERFERYLGLPIANVLSGRGCWAACRFCSIRAWHEALGGARFRQRSPEGLSAEVAWLYRERGVRLFNFHDDNFFHPSRERNLARFARLRECLAARGVGRIGLQIKARPDSVDPGVVDALLPLGLYRVFLGVESNSVHGLKALGRGIRREQNGAALGALQSAGVHVTFNLLMFEPDCSLADLADNVAFIRDHADVPLNFCRTEVYGGTALERDLAAQGRLRGDYFGFDYAIADPAAERAFQVFRRAFWGRNFELSGVNHRAMAVDFELHILRRFWPHRVPGALIRAVKGFVREVNRDSAERLGRVLEFARREATPRELEAFARALDEERARLDAGLGARAADLLREIGRRAGEPDAPPLSVGRRARVAAAAVAVATQLAACNPRSLFSASSEFAGQPPEQPDRPRTRPGPPPADATRCSPAEAQSLTAVLERQHAADLRDLADLRDARELAMVPLRLEYDAKGQVLKALFRLAGYEELAGQIEEAARSWTLPGVRKAGYCDLALRLPVHEEPPDATAPDEDPQGPHFAEMVAPPTEDEPGKPASEE